MMNFILSCQAAWDVAELNEVSNIEAIGRIDIDTNDASAVYNECLKMAHDIMTEEDHEYIMVEILAQDLMNAGTWYA